MPSPAEGHVEPTARQINQTNALVPRQANRDELSHSCARPWNRYAPRRRPIEVQTVEVQTEHTDRGELC